MTMRRMGVLVVWLGCVAFAALVVARARYITDLSAFLPADPTPVQQLLVDQLRDGPASRLILIALEQGDAADRARLSASMMERLRKDSQFTSVNNGDAPGQRDREFLFQHRYLLSEAVNPERFSAAGLNAAIRETIDNLASPAGLLFKSLLPRDPTGELLNILDQLARAPVPPSRDGVWVSADGSRALAVAQTTANGSDSDAQQRAIETIRTAFAAAGGSLTSGHGVQLHLSGPGVFAVAARAKIERAAVRLSIISSILVVALLLMVYRSLPALGLGLLPVTTGAVVGVAAVALGFGAVHGITLGFGITLIGESVDYSVYFFIQSQRTPAGGSLGGAGRGDPLWRTMILGMLTSVCGFASLLPSGFPGLAQLGAYSICGLVAALLVTRYVLPELLPSRLQIRDLTPLGARLGRRLAPIQGQAAALRWGAALSLAAAALVSLYLARGHLWNRELSSLSPIPAAALRYDAQLRADLGAPSALNLVIVPGRSLEEVLRGAEGAARLLAPLVTQKVIGGFDSP